MVRLSTLFGLISFEIQCCLRLSEIVFFISKTIMTTGDNSPEGCLSTKQSTCPLVYSSTCKPTVFIVFSITIIRVNLLYPCSVKRKSVFIRVIRGREEKSVSLVGNNL